MKHFYRISIHKKMSLLYDYKLTKPRKCLLHLYIYIYSTFDHQHTFFYIYVTKIQKRSFKQIHSECMKMNNGITFTKFSFRKCKYIHVL